MIKDFILLYFEVEPTSKFFARMLRLMLMQLDYWYPEAKVHILSNKKLADTKQVVCHHEPTLKPCWSSKFLIYGLLDRPAMYLDLDVLLVRPFSAQDLLTDYNFKVFWSSGPLYFGYNHYNNAVVWIPRPDKEITRRLALINQLYGFWKGGEPWHANDEFATSRYIYNNGWYMPTNGRVNVPKKLAGNYFHWFQSVHYQLNSKVDFLKDFVILPVNRVKLL